MFIHLIFYTDFVLNNSACVRGPASERAHPNVHILRMNSILQKKKKTENKFNVHAVSNNFSFYDFR